MMSFGTEDLIAVVNLQVLVSSCRHELWHGLWESTSSVVLNHNQPHHRGHVIQSITTSQISCDTIMPTKLGVGEFDENSACEVAFATRLYT